MPPNNTLPSLRHMLVHAHEANALIAGRSAADLHTDRTFAMLLAHLMEIVGEASRRVPPEFRLKYPETDWRGFAGLRDVLIHKFDSIDYDELWRITYDELPPLIRQLEAIIAQEA